MKHLSKYWIFYLLGIAIFIWTIYSINLTSKCNSDIEKATKKAKNCTSPDEDWTLECPYSKTPIIAKVTPCVGNELVQMGWIHK